MERRKSDVHVTFKRKRLRDLGEDAYAASATQLESVAPTQLDGAGLPLPPQPGCPLQRFGAQQDQQQLWGPSTAAQHAEADLAAVITQQLEAARHTPCSEDIRRHWPHVQERYREYRRCMAEQQLSPVRLQAFFKHSEERGVPAL